MQKIIVEKPYRFIPPHRGNLLPAIIQRLKLVDKYLYRFDGVASHEVRNAEHLRKSLDAGASVLLAPNHCRYADPLTIGWIARELDFKVYAMASWHLFHQHWLQTFAMRVCGGFSIYREGLDRTSLDTAVDILTEGERPLVLFPEGTVFRTNDRLSPLLDGVSFMTRTAARRREKAGAGKVVVHPVAIKYLFQGDLEATVEPVLSKMEERIAWFDSTQQLSLLERVKRLEEAILSLKEIQYLGTAQNGSLASRKERLIETLLEPLEVKLLGRKEDDSIIPRIKQLRGKLVPELQTGAPSDERRSEIWSQLADIYMAQQIWTYPEGYLDEPTDTRILETVERLEEDLYDQSTIHRPLHAILDVGPAIEVGSAKPKRGEADEVVEALESNLRRMLRELSSEAKSM